MNRSCFAQKKQKTKITKNGTLSCFSSVHFVSKILGDACQNLINSLTAVTLALVLPSSLGVPPARGHKRRSPLGTIFSTPLRVFQTRTLHFKYPPAYIVLSESVEAWILNGGGLTAEWVKVKGKTMETMAKQYGMKCLHFAAMMGEEAGGERT